MTELVTNKLREHVAYQLIESITEPANNVYYIMASKHTPYNGGDEVTPSPSDTVSELEVDIYQEGIFGKKVTSSDISLMVPKYVWTSNTIYDHYDPNDINLYNKPFYVAVDGGSTYYVYKCLDNNLRARSTVQPSSTSESACNFITTADGYTWKLMYKMTESAFEKFATADMMPVTISANVSGNTISGAIDVIRIVNTGSNYVATLTGQFQVDDLRESIPVFQGNSVTYRLSTSASANSDFYVGSAIYISSGTGAGQMRRIIDYIAASRVAVVNSAFTTAPSTDSQYTIGPHVLIDGDGSGAVAYASVGSNSSVNNFISKINVVNRGSGYTYATAIITGNTGGVSNTASLKPIIPPVGGHGFDAPSELGAKAVGFSITFNASESGFITTENDYRKLALIKDPLFTGVSITMDTEVGTFASGETVYQIDYHTLTGSATGNTTSNVIDGIGTELNKSFTSGDTIMFTDVTTGLSCLRTVAGVSNSTQLTLTANLQFNTDASRIAFVDILASGVKSGNASPYINLTNATPKFVTGKTIIGLTSGSTANVTSIDVNEKSYNNWSTFDNRTRISYTSRNGVIPEDVAVFQTDVSLSNAFYHSANSTYVFLTTEKGPINADPDEPIRMVFGSNTVTLGSVKYTPDLIKGSGKVLYIENNSPISRDSSQSETIRLVLNF